jgi:hypothetical protein
MRHPVLSAVPLWLEAGPVTNALNAVRLVVVLDEDFYVLNISLIYKGPD